MCGLAFSGKSTLARKIAEHIGGKRIAFDELWVEKDEEKTIPKDVNGWRLVRKIAQEEVRKSLGMGVSVVYDDTNARFEHREEIRNIAKEVGADSTVIFLNTHLKVIRKREEANRTLGERHEVEPENFQKVLEQLEPPHPDEKVLEFTPETNLETFLQKFH